MQLPPTRFGPAWLLVGAALVGGVMPLSEVVGLGQLGGLLPLLGVGAIIAAPVCLVMLLGRKTRRGALLGLVACMLACGSLYAGMAARWSIRRVMFARLGARFEPLVRAIEAYDREHGHPPTTLAELVPDQIDTIPRTQMLLCSDVRYEVFAEPLVARVSRYDLGGEAVGPARWLPPDASPRRAASLVVVYGATDVVQKVEIDGAPWSGPARAFEADAWMAGRGRVEMARELERGGRLARTTRSEVEADLGPPDEAWVLTRGAWEIRVPCGSGGINFDSFFYWPGHAYPGTGFGGALERIGSWAYVHE